MIVAYTVCTINYLAHARAFYESFKNYHPTIPLIVGLVDRVEGRVDIADYPFEVVEVEQLGVSDLPEMASKYTILELTCAFKPYYGSYLFKTREELTELWYFDTDMLIYNNLDILSERLQHADILITPHFLSPINDNKYQGERDFLNSGLYNAGFFALKRSPEASRFLVWWEERLKTQGYLRYDLGMGSDQLWLNLVPLFFKRTMIEESLGFNVAYWNLHERVISRQDGRYLVNEESPLYFFHFSGFDLKNPTVISKHQNRWTFQIRPDVAPLYEDYSKSIERYNYEYISSLKSVFDKKHRPLPFHAKTTNLLKRRVSFVLWKLIRFIEPNPKI